MTSKRQYTLLADAVAAYEHTITEVQSWSSPDSKTNGGDFSSDVISRAHRLIYHHNWTCGMSVYLFNVLRHTCYFVMFIL